MHAHNKLITKFLVRLILVLGRNIDVLPKEQKRTVGQVLDQVGHLQFYTAYYLSNKPDLLIWEICKRDHRSFDGEILSAQWE